MIATVRRALMRYHGGKWKMAPWIIAHFPPHRIYVEPFGGAASVLLRKPRSYAEIYNDRSGEIVNVFRVLRDRPDELRRALALTPFAREEFDLTYEPTDDPVERARRTVFRSMAGFGSAAATQGNRTGFRAKSTRPGTTPAADWRHYPDRLPTIIERLRGVVIENRDAVEVMAQHDGPETLHYVDPPYVPETRVSNGAYEHEMTEADHRAMATCLHHLRGAVILSGYRCALYDDLFGAWRSIDRAAYADGNRARTETLWLNPAADEMAGLFAAEVGA